MKGKKFYIIVIALLLVGFGSVFLYKQQQEARALEFEGYEISTIENRVDALYNEDKTDIKEDIAIELNELQTVFIELNTIELSLGNKNRIDNMRNDFQTAQDMKTLQDRIRDLFVEEELIYSEITNNQVNALVEELKSYENKAIYYERNNNILTEATVQIENIEAAERYIENLFEDDELIEEISDENLDELEELIAQIKNNTVKEKLTEELETMRITIIEREELALEEIEYEEAEIEEAEIEEVENLEDQEDMEREVDEPKVVEFVEPQREQPVATGENNNTNQTQTSNKQNKSNPNRNSVARIYEEEKVEEIPYSTEINENENLEVGQEVIFSEGSPGKKITVYEITIYRNGTSNRKFLREDIVNPTNRVISVGTKEPKPSQPEEPPIEEGSED